MNRHNRKRGLAGGVLALLLAGIYVFPVSANGYYDHGRIVIVSEPGEISQYVQYYNGDDQQDIADLPWTNEGRTGKGIRLSGNGDHLRLGAATMQVRTFTFSGWINWKGSADAANPAGAYNQPLFTIARNTDKWFTMSPHKRDFSRTDEEGKTLDGLYLGYNIGGQNGTLIEKWNPAVEGVTSYGLPIDEWHHIAVVVSPADIRLYVDGRLWFSENVVTYVGDLNARAMYIGSGIWDDPTLNAVLDDVEIYESDLSEEQIKRLAAGIDWTDTDTPLTTKAPYAPTAPSQDVVSPSAEKITGVQTFFSSETGLLGLPVWGIRLIIGVVIAFFVLSIVLSAMEIYRHRKGR